MIYQPVLRPIKKRNARKAITRSEVSKQTVVYTKFSLIAQQKTR